MPLIGPFCCLDDLAQGHGLEQERPAPVVNAAPEAQLSSSSASAPLCTSAASLSPAATTSASSPSAAATSNRKEGAHCEGEWAQGNEEAQDAGIPSLIRDVLEGGGAEASEAARCVCEREREREICINQQTPRIFGHIRRGNASTNINPQEAFGLLLFFRCPGHLGRSS
jgi:hypothetical protein